MIKENKEYFLYVLGTVVLFVLLVLLLGYLLNNNTGENCGLLGMNCWWDSIMDREKIYENPPEMAIDTSKDYRAKVFTNLGEFEIDLYEQNAPVTVNNFVFLANDEYYNGVKFHRVVEDFIVQTGDRNSLDSDKTNDGKGNPGYIFDDEINWDSLDFSRAKEQQLKRLGYSSDANVSSKPLEKKSVAMANAGPDTNGSQFFIVTAESNDPKVVNLEGQHTVFGIVVSGWEIVEKINTAEVDDPNSDSPYPIEPIIIENIEIYTQ